MSHLTILADIAARNGLEIRTVVLGTDERSPFRIEAPGMRSSPVRDRHMLPGGAFWREIRHADVVLDVGAGDSFADIYGWRRFLRIWAGKLAALAQGRPLVLSPQTFGPFERRLARVMALAAIRRARLVASRDEPSIDFLRSLGYRGEVLLASDLALELPYESAGQTGGAQRHEGGSPRVGFNVSGLLFNGGYTQSNMFGLACDFADMSRRAVRRFAELGAEVHLIGHVNSDSYEVEDDYRVCQRLAGEFPSAVLAPRFSHPSEAKSYIAGLDFFTGARMHACIAAFSAGVPVVPLAYSRKFDGLFGSLGYRRSVDCRSESADSVLEKLEAGFAERATLVREVEAAAALGRERLGVYVEALERLLVEASARRAGRAGGA